jgi:hypothetical protein
VKFPWATRAVLATVDAVLSTFPPHQVTLTVLVSGDDVELYLTFDMSSRPMPDCRDSGWICRQRRAGTLR